MPLYNYQCLDCRRRDQRIAGFDDATAVCHLCGGLMLRLCDPFAASLDEPDAETPYESVKPISR
jgi:putative FmdB family regulatory protein